MEQIQFFPSIQRVSGHHCHATDCKTTVPPEMFMCKKHWNIIPEKLQRDIWMNYRHGQCDDMNPSREYCLIAKICVEFVAKSEGRIPDTKLYDMFLGE